MRLTGVGIASGKRRGIAFIMQDLKDGSKFPENSILVTPTIHHQDLHFIRQAGALVTEEGGILSSAATISRELKIPYVSRVSAATKYIKTGDCIKVNGNKGIVSIVKKL